VLQRAVQTRVCQEYLKEHFPEYVLHPCKLDARMLGCPMARARVYRLLLKNDDFYWSCSHTFQELAHRVLLDPATPGMMTADDLFVASDIDVSAALNVPVTSHMNYEHQLSRREQQHLAKYRAAFPSSKIYDLSQNPDHRARTNLCDGALCCLTTSNKIWGEMAGRWLIGKELLNAVGVPVLTESAQAARVDRASIEDLQLSEHALTSMSGNSMHVPCVGFSILVAALCVEARPTEIL